MNYAAYEAITSYGGIRTEDKPEMAWKDKESSFGDDGQQTGRRAVSGKSRP